MNRALLPATVLCWSVGFALGGRHHSWEAATIAAWVAFGTLAAQEISVAFFRSYEIRRRDEAVVKQT